MAGTTVILGVVIALLTALVTTFLAEFVTDDSDEALEVTRWCLFGGSLVLAIAGLLSSVLVG